MSLLSDAKASVAKALVNMSRLDSIMNADKNTDVTIDNGTVPSIRKLFDYILSTKIGSNFNPSINVTSTTGSASVIIENMDSPTTAFRRKQIIASQNILSGSAWLFRLTRPSDGVIQDVILEGPGPDARTSIVTGANLSTYVATKSLESFGPCGNGNQSEDHAAWIAAQALACTKPIVLVLSPGKEYILDFAFTITQATANTPTPHFRLVGNGATIRVRGAGSGIVYLGTWYTDRSKQEYCEISDLFFIPEGAGTQNAILVSNKYIPSSTKGMLKLTNIRGSLDNNTDLTKYWNTFIQITNVWGPILNGIAASQPLGKFTGVFINIDGLTVGTQIYNLLSYYFNTGIQVGYYGMVGLKGSVTSGTFLPGELVIGQTSNCRAFCASTTPINRNNTTYQMVVAERPVAGSTSGDFTQTGEVLVGQISGARFTLSANGTATVNKNCEAIYCNGGEFVDVLTGFNFNGGTVGDASFDIQIGHQITNWHINARSNAILAQHCDQVMINSLLIYCIPTSGQFYGFNLNNCNVWTISSACEIIGQGQALSTGIVITGTSVGNRIDAYSFSCNKGIEILSTVTSNFFGMNFFACTSDIQDNGAPRLPTANGNSWWRTVSLQASFVGGYQK